MFEDTLLESSLRQTSVLHRIHYIFSAFAGALFFLQGLYPLPLLLAPPDRRALFIMAAMLGMVAALFTLMLFYVWADTRQQHLHAWPWLAVTLLLNLPGFLIYLVFSAQKTGNWKRAAIPLAYVTESVLVGVLILVPLIYTQALPSQWLMTPLHIPPPPGRPPGPPPGPKERPLVHHTPLIGLTAPPTIPTRIVQVIDHPEPPQPEGLGPWVPGVPPGLGPDGPIREGAPWIAGTPQPPPPPQHVASQPQIIRLSSVVVAAKLVYQPKPVYPPLAIAARVQGTVVLQAIIGKDGSVQDLKVVSGHALLIRASTDAVKTWRYQPTLLNSEPVEVLTEIDVIFKLGD